MVFKIERRSQGVQVIEVYRHTLYTLSDIEKNVQLLWKMALYEEKKSGNLFLIAPFPDRCLFVPFYL